MATDLAIETRDADVHMLQRTAADEWWISPDATCGGFPAGCAVCTERMGESLRQVNKARRDLSMEQTRNDFRR